MRPSLYPRPARSMILPCVILLTGLLVSGCGTVIVRGAIKFPVSATGFVSNVHFTFVSDGEGGQTSARVVTLRSPGSAQELTFCGSQVSQFPMNTVVSAKYTQGPHCSTLISVTFSH